MKSSITWVRWLAVTGSGLTGAPVLRGRQRTFTAQRVLSLLDFRSRHGYQRPVAWRGKEPMRFSRSYPTVVALGNELLPILAGYPHNDTIELCHESASASPPFETVDTWESQ